LILIQALESNPADTTIWIELQKIGMTMQKVKELKLKAYRIIGKSKMKLNDFSSAKEDLEYALKFSDDQTTTKVLNELIAECTKKIALQLKKEKSIWKKAFETNAIIPDDSNNTMTPAELDGKKSSLNESPRKPNTLQKKKENSMEKSNNNENENSSNSWSLLSPNYSSLWVFGTIGILVGLGSIGYYWSRKRR
jgi:hypothetical protein